MGLAEARQVCALQAPHVMGSRWKSQNRKNVYLSPYVEEPLNSKVIKSFVPELRSRKCFSYFGIPMFYVYVIYMYISHRYAMSISHMAFIMAIVHHQLVELYVYIYLYRLFGFVIWLRIC